MLYIKISIYDCTHLNYLCKNVSFHVYVSFSAAYFMYIIHTLMCVHSYTVLCFLFAYVYTRLSLFFLYLCWIGIWMRMLCKTSSLHFLHCYACTKQRFLLAMKSRFLSCQQIPLCLMHSDSTSTVHILNNMQQL